MGQGNDCLSVTGTDAGLFDISSSGAVTFKVATTADHETNADGYEFNVVATTGSGNVRYLPPKPSPWP